MDQKTAKLLLKVDDFDNAQDAYEQQLFEIKKSILIQAVIPKVLRKRQEVLGKLQMAFSILNKPSDDVPNFDITIVSGDNWIELHQSYEVNKSEIKKTIAIANKATHIIAAIDQLIQNLMAWSRYFIFDYTEIQLPQLGKEMDSMELYKLLSKERNTPLLTLNPNVKQEYARILKTLDAETL